MIRYALLFRCTVRSWLRVNIFCNSSRRSSFPVTIHILQIALHDEKYLTISLLYNNYLIEAVIFRRSLYPYTSFFVVCRVVLLYTNSFSPGEMFLLVLIPASMKRNIYDITIYFSSKTTYADSPSLPDDNGFSQFRYCGSLVNRKQKHFPGKFTRRQTCAW